MLPRRYLKILICFESTFIFVSSQLFPPLVDVKHISLKDQNSITSSLRRAVASSATEVSFKSHDFASTIFHYLARLVHVMKA